MLRDYGCDSFTYSHQTTKDIYDKLRMILTGEESVKLYLEFLKKNNKVDLLILKNTKVTYMPCLSISNC